MSAAPPRLATTANSFPSGENTQRNFEVPGSTARKKRHAGAPPGEPLKGRIGYLME